jgi:hypothetical protein
MSQGYKTKFKRSADAGVTYTQVAGLIEIEPHEVTRGSVETTTLDDDSGYKTFTPSGLADAGEVSCTLEWNEADTEQGALAADLDAAGNGYYQILYPEGETVSFRGHVTSWGKAVPVEDRITRTVKFKLSEKPTVA